MYAKKHDEYKTKRVQYSFFVLQFVGTSVFYCRKGG
jgi:hypothetical protein